MKRVTNIHSQGGVIQILEFPTIRFNAFTLKPASFPGRIKRANIAIGLGPRKLGVRSIEASGGNIFLFSGSWIESFALSSYLKLISEVKTFREPILRFIFIQDLI